MDEGQTKAVEKDSEFREMKQQLREAHHVISQFYQERRELKRKLAERGSEEQTPNNKIDPMQEMSNVGSQFIFLICPKKLPTPLVSLTTNHRRILR
jgi:chromosome segregation ATPase